MSGNGRSNVGNALNNKKSRMTPEMIGMTPSVGIIEQENINRKPITNSYDVFVNPDLPAQSRSIEEHKDKGNQKPQNIMSEMLLPSENILGKQSINHNFVKGNNASIEAGYSSREIYKDEIDISSIRPVISFKNDIMKRYGVYQNGDMILPSLSNMEMHNAINNNINLIKFIYHLKLYEDEVKYKDLDSEKGNAGAQNEMNKKLQKMLEKHISKKIKEINKLVNPSKSPLGGMGFLGKNKFLDLASKGMSMTPQGMMANAAMNPTS